MKKQTLKRVASLAMASAMILSLTACGGGGDDKGGSSSGEAVPTIDQITVVVKHFCNTLFENSPGISSFKWCFPIIVGMRTDMIVPYVHISV